MTFRQATLADLPEVLNQRRLMCEDMGYQDPHELHRMITTCRPYLQTAMSDGSFRSWLAFAENRAVGGGAVLVNPWPSHPYDGHCRRATVLNVYVYPEFRRQGIARLLMQTMLDWCRLEGFATVFLHASNDGRHLYESLGFAATNEMRLDLRQT